MLYLQSTYYNVMEQIKMRWIRYFTYSDLFNIVILYNSSYKRKLYLKEEQKNLIRSVYK